MRDRPEDERIATGVRNLDALTGGGLLAGTVSVLAGPPGAGKTILTQQIVYHHASPARSVLYFSTLSEPSAKTLRYLRPFAFFDPKRVEDGSVRYVDIGGVLRDEGVDEAVRRVMEQVAEHQPSLVVIDSFKVFSDLAESSRDLRKLAYELAVRLMAWDATALLLGEFGELDVTTNPLFSIVDSLFLLSQGEQSGEHQRFLQLVKMRGTDHRREPHAFAITDAGVEVFAPRLTMVRESGEEHGDDEGSEPERLRIGIDKLDQLIRDGVPLGSSALVAGVAGTGKTVFSLEFLYRGAQADEKGIIFSFEETEERLRAAARGLGWDLDAQIARGMVEIVFIPQPDIELEAHMQLVQDRVRAFGARRVVIDSLSVLMHRVTDPRVAREKTFQLASIVQNERAVGFFTTDIPYGEQQISRFGVEETVIDGVILLSSTPEGLERHRYVEIYKLRNTSHSKGRHSMTIEHGGVRVHPRYHTEAGTDGAPASLRSDQRVPSGVEGLDELLGGGLLERSVTLLSGSTGIGKTTFASQFLVGGGAQEPALFVAFEEGPSQIVESARALGVPLAEARERELIDILYLARESVRPSELLSVLEDRVKAIGARRVVLDGLSHLTTEGLGDDALRRLVHTLVNRLKEMDVTTLLTFESAAMYSTDQITERRFSPVADNLIVLRYEKLPGEIRSTLTVVKTRSSQHDFGTYTFRIDPSVGIRLGPRVVEGAERAG